MRVLFVLDPLDQLQLETETSLLLAQEFRQRGHETWYAHEGDLWVTDRGVWVSARELYVESSGTPRAGACTRGRVADFALVLMRQDPPVDAAYRFAAQALELAASEVMVVNSPAAVLSWNEKLLPLQFPEYCPPTLVSTRLEEMLDFVRDVGRAVVKPISECSGRGIHIVHAGNAAEAIAATMARYPGEPVVLQRYLPEVVHGDKRIFLAGPTVVGAVNRIPAGPERLANIHQGARVEATALSAREEEIARVAGDFLCARGIWLAGLDVIGGLLTEVNITSPSALRQINAVTGRRNEVVVVDVLERLALGERFSTAPPGRTDTAHTG
ncbi:MAG: glutathione synthetase [Candidatus Binatia bacterium]|nr:MAG: glutathione synthetase [Candidatus Binatia bacterium]